MTCKTRVALERFRISGRHSGNPLPIYSASADPNEAAVMFGSTEEHLTIGTINDSIRSQLASVPLTIAFTVGIFIALQKFIAYRAASNSCHSHPLATASI